MGAKNQVLVRVIKGNGAEVPIKATMNTRNLVEYKWRGEKKTVHVPEDAWTTTKKGRQETITVIEGHAIALSRKPNHYILDSKGITHAFPYPSQVLASEVLAKADQNSFYEQALVTMRGPKNEGLEGALRTWGPIIAIGVILLGFVYLGQTMEGVKDALDILINQHFPQAPVQPGA